MNQDGCRERGRQKASESERERESERAKESETVSERERDREGERETEKERPGSFLCKCRLNTARYEVIVNPNRAAFPSNYPPEDPYVPKVSPTVGSMNHLFMDYSRNPFVVHPVVFRPEHPFAPKYLEPSLRMSHTSGPLAALMSSPWIQVMWLGHGAPSLKKKKIGYH
jgi:hypothetical protein